MKDHEIGECNADEQRDSKSEKEDVDWKVDAGGCGRNREEGRDASSFMTRLDVVLIRFLLDCTFVTKL